MNKNISYIVSALIVGLAIGYAVSLFQSNTKTNQESLISNYYATEVATLISPHHIRGKMEKGVIDEQYVLVDLRTRAEYEQEHIAHAINIDSNQSPEIVLQQFKELLPTVGDRKIVIYCYSAACMNGRKVGNLLAQNGVYVHEMTVGWNEWRYYWDLWNYPNELDYAKVEDYVVSGPEPGVATPETNAEGCKIEGELSC